MFRRARCPSHGFVQFVLKDHHLLFIGRLLHTASHRGATIGSGLEGLSPLRPRVNLQSNRSCYRHEEREGRRCSRGDLAGVTLCHPWPEWSELMEMLLHNGYLEHRVDAMTCSPSSSASSVPVCSDAKASNHIRTACLNFARDRDGLIRCLSIHDINVLVRSGCPSIDRKVVNSGKRLRALVGIEERDVCASCSLRGHCERAYAKPREGESGRTVDVIRILFTYALDFTTESTNSLLTQHEMLTRSIRKLLNEVLMFGAKKLEIESDSNVKTSGNDFSDSLHLIKEQMHPLKQGSWTCPICNLTNIAKDSKCLRCSNILLEKLRKQQKDEHLPLKRGDWICNKCNFLNFAKNIRCLQCNEKVTGRQLNPGEWECPSCSYVNFRRNMLCLKCDWRRPKASLFTDTVSEGPSSGSLSDFQSVNQDFHDYLGRSYSRTGSDPVRKHPTTKNSSFVNGVGLFRSVKDEFNPVEMDFEIDSGEKNVSFCKLNGKQNLDERKINEEKCKTKGSQIQIGRISSASSTAKDDMAQMPTEFRMNLDVDSDDEEMSTWFYSKNTKKRT